MATGQMSRIGQKRAPPPAPPALVRPAPTRRRRVQTRAGDDLLGAPPVRGPRGRPRARPVG